MKSYKVLILLFFIVVNSCSKEDEINQLNETIVNLQNDIAQLNSQINEFFSSKSINSQVNQLTLTQNNILDIILNGFQEYVGFLHQMKYSKQ